MEIALLCARWWIIRCLGNVQLLDSSKKASSMAKACQLESCETIKVKVHTQFNSTRDLQPLRGPVFM